MKIRGFTLVELLIVVGILAIFAGIILVAVRPTSAFSEARDSQRRSDVVSVLTAILHYQVKNQDAMPGLLDADVETAQVLGTAVSGCDTTCGAIKTVPRCVDLSKDLVGEYLEAIPRDPDSGLVENSDYYINVTSGGRLIVGACDPENADVISVMR